MSSFHLQIVTPDGSFFDGEANSVVVRTTGGYVSIYPHHTDYIAALDIGRVVVTKDGEPRHAACGGGFLSVEKGEVRLVATTFGARHQAGPRQAQPRPEPAAYRRKMTAKRPAAELTLQQVFFAPFCTMFRLDILRPIV